MITKDLSETVTGMFPDSVIDHYEITGVIGEGGQGVVLQLENGDGKTYTGKVIHRRWSLAPYIEGLKDLRRGVELSQYLDHPSIQTVKEVIDISEQSMFVVVKEYAPGRSLREIIEEEGHVKPDCLSDILEKTVEALEYLHDASKHPEIGQVCHRDIKPDHIIVDEESNVKIIDLDTSKSTDGQTTKYTAAGTKLYQSPEALLGSTSPDGDFYALGFSAIEALLGKIPEKLSDSRLRNSQPYELPEWVPDNLRSALGKMVHPDQSERYTNARNLREDLGVSLEDTTKGEELALPEGKKYFGELREYLLQRVEIERKFIRNHRIIVLLGQTLYSVIAAPTLISSLDYSAGVYLGLIGATELLNRLYTSQTRKKLREDEKSLHLLDIKEQYGEEVASLEEEKLELVRQKSFRAKITLGTAVFSAGSLATAAYGVLTGITDLFTIGSTISLSSAFPTGITFTRFMETRKEVKSLEDRIATAKLPEGVALGEGFSLESYSRHMKEIIYTIDHPRLDYHYNESNPEILERIEFNTNGLFEAMGIENINIKPNNNLSGIFIQLEGRYFLNNYVFYETVFLKSKKEFDKPKNSLIHARLKALKKYSPEVYDTFRAMLPNDLANAPLLEEPVVSEEDKSVTLDVLIHIAQNLDSEEGKHERIQFNEFNEVTNKIKSFQIKKEIQ